MEKRGMERVKQAWMVLRCWRGRHHNTPGCAGGHPPFSLQFPWPMPSRAFGCRGRFLPRTLVRKDPIDFLEPSRRARIVPPTPESLETAARMLRAGRLVAMPTETVYGLAGSAFDAGALARIFEAKDRPTFDPLIVHVS